MKNLEETDIVKKSHIHYETIGSSRPYMAEILPIWHKRLSNHIFQFENDIEEYEVFTDGTSWKCI